MGLLPEVYPEELEGLAMTSYPGPTYAKDFWDTTLAPNGGFGAVGTAPAFSFDMVREWC